MPRSRPVTTGRPRRDGWSICSHEAKKASPSMWTMALGKLKIESGRNMLVLADDAADAGNQGKARQGYAQPGRVLEHERITHAHEEAQRPYPAHLDHDDAGGGRIGALDQKEIARQDAGRGHGGAFDQHEVGRFLVGNEVLV